jgi:hypothetical protein
MVSKEKMFNSFITNKIKWDVKKYLNGYHHYHYL